MDYIEALQNRYSVKKFDKSRIISDEILNRILEAGKLSASSQGLQPYKIHVAASEQKLQELIPAFYNPSQISTCSHLLAIVARKGIEDDYVERYFQHIANVRDLQIENLEPFKNSINSFKSMQSPEEILVWNEKQGYILLGNLMFAAALEKVDTCPIEGFRSGIIEEILGIDSETEKVTVTLALGYRADDDPFSKNKKVRKPDDLLYRFH